MSHGWIFHILEKRATPTVTPLEFLSQIHVISDWNSQGPKNLLSLKSVGNHSGNGSGYLRLEEHYRPSRYRIPNVNPILGRTCSKSSELDRAHMGRSRKVVFVLTVRPFNGGRRSITQFRICMIFGSSFSERENGYLSN